ncbi:MAG: iron-containing alcohol dehydrogenase [Desulfobacterales bacterium]|nr:iron-containing alcohol dehydrogenase [Desulfobacterales bacterium]
MPNFDLFMPTRIVFGPGRLDALETTAHLPEAARAMIVVGAGGSMLRQGYLGRVQGLLAARGVRSLVYDRVGAMPATAQIDEAAGLAQTKAVDVILGLGGGSSIDAAKAIAFLARNPGRCEDYINDDGSGEKTSAQSSLPMVAIPTTAGIGAETNPICVITRSGHAGSFDWRHPSMFPRLALVDSDLTLTLPADRTALAGMVAFFHAVGALLSTARQPTADLLALEAVQIVAGYLPRAVADGGDREARCLLMWAGTAAGICASLASGLSLNTLALALSNRAPEWPYGAALTMLAPAYFDWLAQASPERFDLIAAAMGAAADAEHAAGAGSFHDALIDLIRAVGLGPRAASAGDPGDFQAAAIARTALRSVGRRIDTTPVPMHAADAETILTGALGD